ncbi:hypothetical protein BIY26_08855 [Brenneria goodwinii]|uniref:Uncharacterized protein n=1 Tax=Brenneria goodwinii TaxID=1109412 RepID=A0AAE8EP46_9GAMM|nr:hypothetical protein [Brenneria goodwinii]RLM25368.1 hypothetical protein BIY26_08855 [Brenneria goodwinii]
MSNKCFGPVVTVPQLTPLSNALNSAAWKLWEGLSSHGMINGAQFNAMKGILAQAIDVYLRETLEDSVDKKAS